MDAARTFSVFADYNQFFLLDDIVQPPYPDVIPQSAIEQRFQIIPHLIAVYTSDATTVSVKVKICEVEPKPNLESWSHIVRCPLEVPSGRMTLAGCTDYLPSCPRIEVPSGKCGVLISLAASATAKVRSI